MMSIFTDRRHAGRVLASALGKYAGRTDVVVLALPRGGVPVAYEVAQALGAPLDVFVVRKLGVPGHEELAMGALASGGLCVMNEHIVRTLGITKKDILKAARAEKQELGRRDRAYRGERALVNVSGKTVILVDDGLATGSTMRAAIRALRQREPARVVVAVPIAAPETCSEMSDEADDTICSATPEPFYAVGRWYEDFSQTSDEEVRDLLEAARREHGRTYEVVVPAGGGLELTGTLGLPDSPMGIVLFAHGSGSGRHSPRNQFVARFLESRGLGTLLVDLLSTAEEEAERQTQHLRFDIDLLAGRLVEATSWLVREGRTRLLPIGYFGASTGAAAALVAAARSAPLVGAVVSRGGRPDLAGEHLRQVRCPTLLIVGGDDGPVIDVNRDALRRLRCHKELEIVPRATHLFEEPGALESVAELAAGWFVQHLHAHVPLPVPVPTQAGRWT